MSTPDQPDTPPLTRRQMRELRNTGSTPIIPADDATPVAEEEPTPTPVPAAPLPRAAAPASIAPAPVEDIDLGVNPLTRRQARQHERIRTASVPVITPDVAAAHAPVPAVITTVPGDGAPAADELVEGHEVQVQEVEDQDIEDHEVEDQDIDDRDHDVDAEVPPAQVNPALGSDLLAGEVPAAALPASFDQLIARNASATGSVATPNALILSQTPAGAPLVAPVTATGEVLITGTFELPDGLGSVGHLPGAADGKDLDVALIDGELPPASSPTPIAASAAISTVRNSGEEIIRPPAPDKSNRWTVALTITAGVLVLALAGVLVWALTTGRI